MKKQVSLFVLAALVSVSPVYGATNFGTRAGSSADLSGMPATRQRSNVNYEKYETRTTTRTYDAADARNIYYTSPSNRSAIYRQYDMSARPGTTTTTVRTTRAETARSEMKRKYYLAHPFYQPLQGKFGSITDLSYNLNSYDFTLSQPKPVAVANIDDEENPYTYYSVDGQAGKWNMTGFSIKEDFSYGITDRIALVAMLRYDINKYEFEWSNGDPSDSMDDNGLNLYGIGGQWRFVDNSDWIATVSAYYQHQKDIANYFLLDLKGGYKIARSTIYGLLRGWYVDIDGDAYGNGVESDTAKMFLAYKADSDKAFYVEAGAGVFSVLDEDWTLNLEAIFGSYDWHNQLSVKGAIGWQPNDWFAVELYGKVALYDSADDKNLALYWKQPNIGLLELTRVGESKVDNYSEASVGLRVMFEF